MKHLVFDHVGLLGERLATGGTFVRFKAYLFGDSCSRRGDLGGAQPVKHERASER